MPEPIHLLDWPKITITDVSKSFVGPHGRKDILKHLSMKIPRRSLTTIFGPNGCGKTTLMNLIAGLDTPDSGDIHWELEQHSSVSDQRRTGTIGFVFQDYRRSLLPWLSVEENILYPLTLRNESRMSARKQLDHLCYITQFSVHLKTRVSNLSGGQAQFTCLLRALIIQPDLLILDEPFSALDYGRTLFLRQELLRLKESLHLTIICISHDLDEALYLGDQLVMLSQSPTHVIETLPIPLAGPRTIDHMTAAPFVGAKKKALELLAPVLLQQMD